MGEERRSSERHGYLADVMTQFAVHSNTGILFREGPPSFNDSTKYDGKIKSLTFSADGKRFAFISNGEIHVHDSETWERLGLLKHPKSQEVCFSPKGKYLAVYDSYTKTQDQNQVSPNLSVYDVQGKKLLKAFMQQSQTNWQPQWTADEHVMMRCVPSEAHFYTASDLSSMSTKKVLPKMRSASLSPSNNNHYVTVFMPPVQSNPAYVHLYKYPHVSDASKALAHKSFFKVDSMENFWNKQANAVLLLTAGEVDKTGNSYYGEHMLFYMNTKGDSERITFNKAGNIHSVAWMPGGKEFFVVYGSMPSMATLFNLKCQAVAEFGTGPRNTVIVNPVGNIVMLGGFGNISARFEMWDVAKRSKIGETECADTTHTSWSPCGQYLMTATCTPRLRVNNGYKVWHYTAVLQNESQIEEMYSASYRPNQSLAKPFQISTKAVQGITPTSASASKQRYIPPSQRGKLVGGPPGLGIPINTEKKYLSQIDNPELVPTEDAKKNKKEKTKKQKSELSESWHNDKVNIEEFKASKSTKLGPVIGIQVNFTGDPEKDKKIKALKKKLDAIAKLKEQQEDGKTLEPDQQTKVNSEEQFLKELEELQL